MKSSYLTLPFSLLLSALALAASPLPAKDSPVEITLERRNHLGLQRTDVLEIREGIYVFNGKALGKNLPAVMLNSWKEIQKGPGKPVKIQPCSAGDFTFKKIEPGTTAQYSGCTEGDSYGQLIENLEKLRKFSKGV
jgi:hypothetical protein